jgi:hypothetical protein
MALADAFEPPRATPWNGPHTASKSPGRIIDRPGVSRGPAQVPHGLRTTPRIALVDGLDPPKATPWNGPHTASKSPGRIIDRPGVSRGPAQVPPGFRTTSRIAVPSAEPPPTKATPTKATPWHGPHTAGNVIFERSANNLRDDPSDIPDPPMKTFPAPEEIPFWGSILNAAVMAESPKPPAPLPTPSQPPGKSSTRASMFHGPHTADPTRAQAPADMSPNCKAPYQIGNSASSSAGTCVQYMSTATAVSKVNCAGCPSPQSTASSTSTTAFVGFGGLFGPGPMIVRRQELESNQRCTDKL